jgi:hypothetical protein
VTGLWAGSREAFTQAVLPYTNSLYTAKMCAATLIDTGVIRVLDPGDAELVEHRARPRRGVGATMKRHPPHDHCEEAHFCYEAGYGAGWLAALDAYGRRRCWCGGEVGPREPGDAHGLGCLSDIYHIWTAAPSRQP